jgi:hypothetical protein
MRKLMMILTLAVAFLSVTGVASAVDPPQCGDDCPFVR